MRACVLLVGLLLAGNAAAAPASNEDVGQVMGVLGMSGLGSATGLMLLDQSPAFAKLDAQQKSCAGTAMGQLLDAQFRRQAVQQLGDDGAAVMAEWKTFLATPAGADMGRTFQAIALAQTGQGDAAAAKGGMDAAHRDEIARFMGSPAFQRFIGAVAADGGLPDDVAGQMAGTLQQQCGIALDAEQNS